MINVKIALKSSKILFCINTILKLYTSPSDHVATLNTDFVLDVPVFNDFPVPDRLLEKYPFSPHVYVADLKNINLRGTLEDLKEKYQLNSRAKFIIITENVSTDITEVLAEYFIVNVALINPILGKISTYFPYKHKSLNDIDTEIIEVGNCLDFQTNRSLKSPLFEEKIPEVWNHASIKMCLMYEPPYSMCDDCENKGISASIFDEVIRLMNMTAKWRMLEFPESAKFVQYYYTYMHTNKHCDIHVGLLADYFYDHTIFYVFDEIYFLAPSPELIPRWQYLLRALTVEIWICWIITILVFSCLWVIIRRIHGFLHGPKVAMEVIWTNIEYFIEHSHNISSRMPSLKILFLSIFLLSYLMNMIFKCNFNYILTGINFQESIDSVTDIIKRGMTVGVLTEDFLFASDEKVRKYFETHITVCNYSYYCFDQTAYKKNLISYQSLRFYKYVQDSYLDEDGIPLMRLIKPHHVTVWLCGILPLGHPIRNPVNKYLSYLDAHGFTNLILSKYDVMEVQAPSNFKARRLSFEHILAPSVILLIGIILGLISFVLEITHYI
ncbi:hypothetical protein WA026_006180 [Henosepilachna vigintioctopunctata]|uniref:Ionotropic receptor n=1 Tax=Henosepilachna vigintioctopunctata TaxID=420089 RepID=A0AAW1TJP5_9CUCU